MGKNKTTNSKLLWLMGTIVIILAFGLWVWPTYLAPSTADPALSSTTFSGLVDQYLDIEQAYQKRQEGAYLLDVRTIEEWEEGYIPGATLIPLDQLSTRYSELPTDQEIVIYCRSGNRSSQALSLLDNVGFSTIYSMDGGINDWISSGYEVTTGN